VVSRCFKYCPYSGTYSGSQGRDFTGVAASLEERIAAEEKEDIICWKTWFQCPFFAVVDEEYY